MNTYELATIQYWAERTVKANAFFACKSLANKRGGNSFYYADRVAARYTGLTEVEFVEARNSFIANNPMKYAATTGKLTYLVGA